MNSTACSRTFIMMTILYLCFSPVCFARIKLSALPDRGDTIIRLDNPHATLIEEERILTLQKGRNEVDFSWKGVRIDADSIRLHIVSAPVAVSLLSVSYPPNEDALVWSIHSMKAIEAVVRISYLLEYIDSLAAYKAFADKSETRLDLKSFLILRNFSGEDFNAARILPFHGAAFNGSILHEETKQILVASRKGVPVEKVWTFDAARLPWDPEKLDENVGIPVSYRIHNTGDGKLGKGMLQAGKVRLYQDDGHSSSIFLGEDTTDAVPIGETMELYIGDSRDIVVTQRKMQDKRINVKRNTSNQVVLYDTDEIVTAVMENFKDSPAKLTMLQHIPGQWEMKRCTLDYRKKDASTLEFSVTIPAQSTKKLEMHYHRRNVR